MQAHPGTVPICFFTPALILAFRSSVTETVGPLRDLLFCPTDLAASGLHSMQKG